MSRSRAKARKYRRALHAGDHRLLAGGGDVQPAGNPTGPPSAAGVRRRFPGGFAVGVELLDDHISPALARLVLLIAGALGAKHHQALAMAQLGVVDEAAIALVDDLALEALSL